MTTRLRCLTLAMVVVACRGDAERAGDTFSDTIAPTGTGTELLLTRERLDLIDGWIRASIAHTGRPPRSMDDVQPPEADAARYVPLGQFLRDGWGRAIEYTLATGRRSYELRSPGPDGALGTADDVTRRGTM